MVAGRAPARRRTRDHRGRNGREALECAEQGVDLVLLDYRLPDGTACPSCKKLRDIDPDTLVIMLTAHTGVETVVEAMKPGAFDYATKPFDLEDMALRVVARARDDAAAPRTANARATRWRGRTRSGRSSASPEPMQRVKTLVRKVASSPGSTVLITGESGTGKDLVAKVIHYSQRRAGRPFLNITCSALPENAARIEMFGHETRRVHRCAAAEARFARDRPTKARCFSTKSAR